MAKFKARKIVKWHDKEKYIFVKGIAKVPGMWFTECRVNRIGVPRVIIPFRKQATITLKDFKELTVDQVKRKKDDNRR